MSEYKGIKGYSISGVSAPTGIGGQIWYNTTDRTFQFASNFPQGVWSTAPNLNTGRYYATSEGTQTDAVMFGGNVPPLTAAVENYNGTSWATGTSLPVATEYIQGAGASSTSAIGFGGADPVNPSLNTAYTYNGSAWTAAPTMVNTHSQVTGFGLENSALSAGSNPSGTPSTGNTEFYNGTAWTELNPMLNTSVRFMGGAGVSTSGLVFGGNPAGPGNMTEVWDGTSWTSGANKNIPVDSCAGAGTSNTSALAFNGEGPSAVGGLQGGYTENWNGTSWSAGTQMLTGRSRTGGNGTKTAALAVGGDGAGPVASTYTEEYNAPGIATKTTILS